MLEYTVSAKRLDDTGSEATARGAHIILETGMAGRPDALNPAELLLASLATCMIKGAERVAPMLPQDVEGRDQRKADHGDSRACAPPNWPTARHEMLGRRAEIGLVAHVIAAVPGRRAA